jgi:glucokinase
MLGIEIRDASVVAVAVDGEGLVLRRAFVPFGGGVRLQAEHAGEVATAAIAALNEIADPGSGPDLAGVACPVPESPACAAVLQAVAGRHAPCAADAPIASGPAAAAAEAWIGAARGAGDAVFFSAGRHMAAGIVRGGEVILGAHRRAGAISWLALNPVEREDYRKTGCLEAEAASSGIVRRFVWRVKAGDHSTVQDTVGGDLGAVTLDHILDGARAGDGVAISIVRDTAKYLGMAAANLTIITDPHVLVVGGIMASAADVLMEPLRTEIGRRLPPAMMQGLSIVPAALGDDAAAIGAAYLLSASLR